MIPISESQKRRVGFHSRKAFVSSSSTSKKESVKCFFLLSPFTETNLSHNYPDPFLRNVIHMNFNYTIVIDIIYAVEKELEERNYSEWQ
ncbi:CLUMA_CG001805, isoform A [Clunio marinus]|uniref:CLUMA_CG001805, isoform A n=1 Tax=Clunio marinus TaxID=568069 RepID=A0A1J1HJC8_9DIPT|nr:CLUMA_CG001805, isoform A [Clunio marinus]